MMKKTKNFDFQVKNVELDEKRNIGIIEGYASTFGNVDREGDVFEQGAFSDSIKSYQTKKQMIPMLSAHRYEDQIGGYDPSMMIETNKGLKVVGEVDLDTQLGRDKYSLAKKGYLTSFSIGFQVTKDNYKMNADNTGFIFEKVDLLEISLVPVPANTSATFSSVKTATPYKNYPLMDDNTEWDADKAEQQIKDKTGSDDAPTESYKNGFMYYDSASADTFGAYKLPYTYIVDGEFKAVPNALSAIVGVLNGARGGADIPAADQAKIKRNVNGYYAKMGKELPFPDSGTPASKSFTSDDNLSILNKIEEFSFMCKLDALCEKLSK